MKKMKHGGKARKTHKRMQDGGMAGYGDEAIARPAVMPQAAYSRGKVGTSAFRPVPGVAGSADSTQAGMPVPTPTGGFRGPGATYRPAFNKSGMKDLLGKPNSKEMSPREMALNARREERYAEREARDAEQDARRDARRSARLGVGNYSGPRVMSPGAMNPSVAPQLNGLDSTHRDTGSDPNAPLATTGTYRGGPSTPRSESDFRAAADSFNSVLGGAPSGMRKGGAVKGKRMAAGGMAYTKGKPGTPAHRPVGSGNSGGMYRPAVPPPSAGRPSTAKPSSPRAMRGGGLARKGVGMALAKGGLAKRAGGCAKRGVGRGKMV